jgi:hypothetical protein
VPVAEHVFVQVDVAQRPCPEALMGEPAVLASVVPAPVWGGPAMTKGARRWSSCPCERGRPPADRLPWGRDSVRPPHPPGEGGHAYCPAARRGCGRWVERNWRRIMFGAWKVIGGPLCDRRGAGPCSDLSTARQSVAAAGMSSSRSTYRHRVRCGSAGRPRGRAGGAAGSPGRPPGADRTPRSPTPARGAGPW